MLSRTKRNTNMYSLADFIVPGISEDCCFALQEVLRGFLSFYCKDTQAVELEVPVALAACGGKAERFKRRWTVLFTEHL